MHYEELKNGKILGQKRYKVQLPSMQPALLLSQSSVLGLCFLSYFLNGWPIGRMYESTILPLLLLLILLFLFF